MTDNSARADLQEGEPATAETRAGADIIYLPDERQRTKKATSGSNKRKRQNLERFRTDDAEHDALHEQLRSLGLSLGEYVMRIGAIEGGKISRARRRREIKAADIETLSQNAVALNRIGNNQNQEMRALNEIALIAREQGVASLESVVVKRIDELRQLPNLLAEPLAVIMAVLNNDSEG